MIRGIVPPYLLRHLSELDDSRFAPAALAARRSLALDVPFRGIREGEPSVPGAPSPGRPGALPRVLGDPDRSVFDAGHTERLPGTIARTEGQPAGADDSVNDAYDGLGHTHALFREAFGRASIDNDNLPLLATVHFGRDYDNAFWDGSRMVFGDGDGVVFGPFTSSLSVIGHELTHGVSGLTVGFTYQGQSGALSESVSDVFGALVEQFSLGQSGTEASWLIGEGLFTPAVQGSALRSMKAPGTAYDDDVLGKDPQPAEMSGFVATADDNGGVHINSGIPNRAFYLAATDIGGPAWERPGRIWYDTIVGGNLGPASDFSDFARATTDAAAAAFGPDSRERTAVQDAWGTVGVTQ